MRGLEIREARETSGENDRLGAAVVVASRVANGEPFRLRVQRRRTITSGSEARRSPPAASLDSLG